MRGFALKVFRKCRTYIDLALGSFIDALHSLRILKRFPPDSVTSFGAELDIENSYPANFNSADVGLFELGREYQTFSADLYHLKDVLVTTDGVVLRGANVFMQALPHPIFRRKFGLLYNIGKRLFSSKGNTDPHKKYLLVFDFWAPNNYYHWIIDSLSRVYWAKTYMKAEHTILLPEGTPSFVAESLKKFNVHDVTIIPKNHYLKIKDLYVMSYTAGSGRVNPETAGSVRQCMIENTARPVTPGPKKVYVSRGKQKARRVANEAEVIELVKSKGFTVVYFEGMSFDEQIQSMQGVTHYISSHGANMTNTLFLPEKARVLELIKNGNPNFCYWALAAGLGLNYRYQLCPVATSDHIHVDMEEFKKNLDALLEQ